MEKDTKRNCGPLASQRQAAATFFFLGGGGIFVSLVLATSE